MNVQVKICGIRTVESGLAASAAGADFLGFNFVPSSKRYLEPALAQTIISQLKGLIAIVGIFQDATLSEVNRIADRLDLDFVQLHGAESPEYVQQVQCKVIKAFTPQSMQHYSLADYPIAFALLDRLHQGRGALVDPEQVSCLNRSIPTFLAGGLVPENVGAAIRAARPFGVDVAGGIETDGIPDATKIRQFIRNTKEACL